MKKLIFAILLTQSKLDLIVYILFTDDSVWSTPTETVAETTEIVED